MAPISPTRSLELDLARTLFIVSSKTFTTQETMANAASARARVVEALGEAAVAQHFAAVSTRLDKVAEFGIAPDRVFGFWDWVGGRYSLWSAIGLALAISVGPENFMEFLRGGFDVDEHFRAAPIEQNIPALMGLLGVFHRNALGRAAHAVIPYDQRLARFPAYLQQLDMESNGKSVRRDGSSVETETGPVIFGEPGTNGQHAFFQLLHQGTDVVPIDFLIAAEPVAADEHHHDLLFANCLAQSEAFMRGRTLEEAQALLAQGGKVRGRRIARLAPHKVFARRSAVEHLHLSAPRSPHARASRRALRAQGLRAVGHLGHQSLRPMGRGARQGARQSSCADRRRSLALDSPISTPRRRG